MAHAQYDVAYSQPRVEHGTLNGLCSLLISAAIVAQSRVITATRGPVSYMEEQPPFASEQVSWIDQLVAGRLPPQCRVMHCASEVAGGTLGASASVSLVTMALRREPCCYHVVLRPSFRRGIIGGHNVANFVRKLLTLPLQGCHHAAKLDIDCFYLRQ